MAIDNEEELRKKFINARNKLMQGQSLSNEELSQLDGLPDELKENLLLNNKIVSGEELTPEEQNILENARKEEEQKEMQNPNRPQPGELEDKIIQFQNLSNQHFEKGGVRVNRIGDTENSPDDLRLVLQRQLGALGGKPHEKDFFFHAGDLLEDFVSFSDLQRGNSQAFRAERIAKDGGLEGAISNEFKKSYKHILEKHGITDHQLLEGQVSEQLMKGLQSVYYGVMPQFATQKEKEEYIKHFEIFQKHFEKAAKNDAKKKYEAYKEVFEEFGLTPDNFVIVPGNHDVFESMYDVLGDYIPEAGKVFEKKGMKFLSPFHGSTGAHLGPEFSDTFGYVDSSQKIEQIKQDTQAFKELHKYLNDKGVDYISKKDLSELINRSEYRASLGIGKGYSAIYMEERIKPQLDTKLRSIELGAASNIPDEKVDFYLMHGQPNHPTHKGLEEYAIFQAIKKKGGGTILHGHQHGNTTHKEGNVLLLNEGDGKANFGSYLHTPGKGVDLMFTQEYNRNLETLDYKLNTPRDVRPQNLKGVE